MTPTQRMRQQRQYYEEPETPITKLNTAALFVAAVSTPILLIAFALGG